MLHVDHNDNLETKALDIVRDLSTEAERGDVAMRFLSCRDWVGPSPTGR